MTVAEIKAALDEKGVSYDKDAKKADLEALLAKAEETASEEPEETAAEEPEEAPVAEEIPTEIPTETEPAEEGAVRVRVRGGSLNIRRKPDKKASVAKVVSEGTTLVGEFVDDTWFKTTDGTYCMRDFVAEL